MYYFVIDEKGLSFSLFWKYMILGSTHKVWYVCSCVLLELSKLFQTVYGKYMSHFWNTRLEGPKKTAHGISQETLRNMAREKCIDIVHQHAKKIATILPPTFVRIACFAHAHGDSACIQASYSWIRLHIAPLSQNLNLSKVCHSFSEGPAQVLWPARVRSAIPGWNSQT